MYPEGVVESLVMAEMGEGFGVFFELGVVLEWLSGIDGKEGMNLRIARASAIWQALSGFL